MKLKTLAIVGLLPALAGCADLTTGLMMYNDQLAAEQGYFYDDEHNTDPLGDDDGYCSGYVDYGHVNNQTYLRVRNRVNRTMHVEVTWNSGSVSYYDVEPLGVSDYTYMSPSLWPSQSNTRCD